MTCDKSKTPLPTPAERRGDDTHWWKAYEAHSKAIATGAPVRPGESTQDPEQSPATGGAPPAAG